MAVSLVSGNLGLGSVTTIVPSGDKPLAKFAIIPKFLDLKMPEERDSKKLM